MTTTEQPPDTEAAPEPDPPRDTRLSTWISKEADHRLHLAYLVTRTPITQLVDHLLRLHLPTAADLTEQLRGGATDER